MRTRVLLYVLPALSFFSCSNEDSQISENQLAGTEEVLAHVEVAYPNEIGSVSEVYFAGQKLTVEEVDGDYIYEGDIMFSPDMLSSQPGKLVYEKGEIPHQKSVGRTSGYWPNNTVYYSIDGNLSKKERVTNAIKHWEENTSLKFVQRTSERNYIYFTTGSGCSSYIGMIGGRQNITISSGCSTGSTIHEIGHAVGLWHEQSRVDRDKHIKILYENIQSGKEHNFQTYSDSQEFTSILDFGSIMMYGPYSFSSNGNPTITKTNGSTYSIQRSILSVGDKEGIDTMYPSDPNKPITYINGEYYTIAGLTVLRMNDNWYYKHPRWGFKLVELKSDGIWYWV